MACTAPRQDYIDAQRAEILARFPKVRKNSAGYALDRYLESEDLLDLVIGAEGTLGIITDLNVALDAIPLHRSSLRVAIGSRADLVPAIEAIRPHDPSTIEFLDASFLRLVEDRFETPEAPGLLRSAAGILLADFEGDDTEAVNGRARGCAAEEVGAHAHDHPMRASPATRARSNGSGICVTAPVPSSQHSRTADARCR